MKQTLLIALVTMMAIGCASQRNTIREDERIDISEFRAMTNAMHIEFAKTGTVKKSFFSRFGRVDCNVQLECVDENNPYICAETAICRVAHK